MFVPQENILHYQYKITIENLILEILFEKIDHPTNIPLAMISDHTHPYIEIFVCKKSSIQINSPEGMITIAAGDVAIVPSNIPHHCLNEHDDDAWLVLSFIIQKYPKIECQDMYRLLEPFSICDKILILHDKPELFSIIKEITDNYNKNRIMIPVLYLVYQLCKYSEENNFRAIIDESTEITHDSSIVRMNLLDRIINREFMLPITGEETAKKLHISTRQLARIVKQRYNKTLFQVVLDKRLSTAAEMLRTTNMSAEKIAITVGFSSKNSFWNEFKKKYGVTPAEYRNR